MPGHLSQPACQSRAGYRSPFARVLWVAVFPLACATILNIDGDYVPLEPGTGGRANVDAAVSPEAGNPRSGGSAGGGSGGAAPVVGGATGSGGTPPGSGGGASPSGGSGGVSGGATGSGGTIEDCSQRGCADGLKCCGSPTADTKACYSPSPLVGCGDTGCDYCSGSIPNDSTKACIDKRCSFECNPGYVLKGAACVPMATGGVGGTDSGSPGGTGGATCVDGCVGCGPAGPFGCCLPFGNTCGCSFFNIEIGGSTSIGYCLPRPPPILPPR